MQAMISENVENRPEPRMIRAATPSRCRTWRPAVDLQIHPVHHHPAVEGFGQFRGLNDQTGVPSRDSRRRSLIDRCIQLRHVTSRVEAGCRSGACGGPEGPRQSAVFLAVSLTAISITSIRQPFKRENPAASLVPRGPWTLRSYTDWSFRISDRLWTDRKAAAHDCPPAPAASDEPGFQSIAECISWT